MPGPGPTIIVGGGISGGSPLTLDHFLKISSVSPPVANTSTRLISRATSIEILGDGALSTAIGNNADANGAETIAIGLNVSTAQAESLAIGRAIALGNTGQLAIGSISSAAGTYNLASAFTALGMTQAYTLFPSNSVFIGTSTAGGGNSAVAVGASAAITGNASIAIGANSQAGLNSLSIGQLATSGTAGAAHNISIGVNAIGPSATNGCILVGNRNGASGTIAAGDIVLGHQDVPNSIYSRALWLGGPAHASGVAVPAFEIRGRTANGTNLAAGDLTIIPARASGTAAGGGVLIQATAPAASGPTVQTATTALRVDPLGNITLAAAAGSYGSGAGVVFIGNSTTAPTANPVGGGILYCVAGALLYRGSAGTVTPLAPA